MSEAVDWGWVKRTLTAVQAEQRMLRGIVEPLPKRFQAMEERMSALEARFGGLEARFGALEARIGGLEEEINGIGLLLEYQAELLEKLAGGTQS